MQRLRLTKLEERIAFDATALATVFNANSYEEPPTEQTSDGKETSDVSKEPVPSWIESDLRVLIIGSNISSHELLEQAAEEHSLVIPYETTKTSLEQLSNKLIQTLNGRTAHSIAFACHGTEKGSFQITATNEVSLSSLMQSEQMKLFWKKVGSAVDSGGRIDLLACEIGKAPEAFKFVSQLEWLTKRSIALSNEKVGSANLGGSWILNEIYRNGAFYKAELDVSRIYFNSKLLNDWSGVLALPVDLGVSDRSSDNFLLNQPILDVIDSPQKIYVGQINNSCQTVAADDNSMVTAGAFYTNFFQRVGEDWVKISSFTHTSSYDSNAVISGDWAAVGRYLSGSVYIYHQMNGTWSFFQEINNPSGFFGGFGYTMSIYTDPSNSANNRLLIGAYSEFSSTGAAYFFKYNGTSWVQDGARILPTDGTAGSGSAFGISVDLSANRAVIGASSYSSYTGTAYVFEYISGVWTQVQRLVPVIATSRFGYSVSLSGDRIAISALDKDVYIFEKGLASNSWTQTAKLTPLDGTFATDFGRNVILKGNTLLVNNYSNDVIASNGGCAYLFEKKPNGWTQVKQLAEATIASGDQFGIGIALTSEFAIIGAFNTSSALVYKIKDRGIGFDHYHGLDYEVTPAATIVDGSSGATLLDGLQDIKVKGQYAYVVASNDAAVTIFDISNPYSPAYKGSFGLGFAASAFDMKDSYLYISKGLGGNSLVIIDISDPSNPILSSTLPITDAGMVKVLNNYLYVHTSADTTLRIYDISTPSSPSLVGTLTDATHLTTATSLNQMTVEGQYLYIKNSADKLSIINVSNRTNPIFAAEITGLPAIPQAIAVKNNYLYILSPGNPSIRIYDITTPTSPVLVKNLANGIDGNYLASPISIQIRENYAYIASSSENAVSIIDVSNPLSAHVIKEIVYGSNNITGLRGVRGLAVQDSFLYTADEADDALSVFKLHTPDSRTVFSKALQFDGANDYAQVDNFTGINTSTFSVEMWIKVASLPSVGNSYTLFSYASLGIPAELSIAFTSSNAITLSIHGLSTSSLGFASAFTDNQYHHLAFTYNRTSTNWKIYKDGSLLTSGTLSTTAVLTTPGILILGQLQTTYGGGFSSSQSFKGYMSEVRFWNTERTQNQIIANMRSKLIENVTALKAYYRFTEESGQRIYDLSQNAQNGYLGSDSTTESIDPIRVVAALPLQKQSLLFDGIDDYVEVTSNTAFNTSSLTISAWIKTSTNDNNARGIVNRYTSNSGYLIYLKGGNVYGWVYRTAANYINSGNGIDAGFVADGQWHHISLVFDSSGGKMYRDGALINTLNWTGTSGTVSNSQNIQIGLYNSSYFQGEITDISLWNTALTQSYIQHYIAKGIVGSESNLIAYYSFNEGSGLTLKDGSSNNFDGTLNNGPAWKKTALFTKGFERGLYFDGVNDLATIPDVTDFNSYPLTISFCINTQTIDTTVRGIISKYAAGSNNGYQLYLYNGTIVANYYADTSNYIANGTSFNTGLIADGRNHHISFIVDNTGGRLYLDGILAASHIWTGVAAATTTTQNIILGSYNGAYFKGILENISFWKVALSQQQVQDFMHNPIPNYQIGLIANYKFNENLGQYFCDYSGNGYNGYLGSSSTVNTDDPQYILSGITAHSNRYLIGNKELILTINGSTLDNSTFSAIIKSLPAQGALYQYDSTQTNFCGTAITTADTPVTDSLKRIVYSPHMGGASSYATVYFDYSLSDGITETNPSSVCINLMPPQEVSGTSTGQTTNDNGSGLNPFNAINLANTELCSSYTYRIEFTSANGIFTAASLTTSGFSLFSDDGTTKIYQLTTTPAIAQAAMRALVFRPTNNQVVVGATVTTTFTIKSADIDVNSDNIHEVKGRGFVSDTTTTVITTSINDAPVLVVDTPTLNAITEDDTNNVGQTVASIINSTITDVDYSAVQGIAIIGVTISSGPGSGKWQFSADATTWYDVSPLADPVSVTNALLLRSSDYIRFLPDQANGCTATFTYCAWDQTSGVYHTKADVSTNGGTTAFSLSTNTATIIVTSVNDPSVFSGTSAGQTVNDNATIHPFSALTISDVDYNQSNTYTITLSDKSNGSLSATGGFDSNYDPTTGIYTFIGTAAAAQVQFRNLVFTPTANQVSVGSTVTTTFILESTDGAVPDSTTTVIANSVNDAPQLTAGAPSLLPNISEDDPASAAYQFSSFMGTITDVDSGALTGVAITGTFVSTGTGYWEYYDTLLSAWTAIGSVSDSHALLLYTTNQIRFIPDGKNGCTATITYRAWDQTNGAGTYHTYVDTSGTNNGGTTPFSTATETATLIVDSVNDAPQLTAGSPNLLPNISEDDPASPAYQFSSFIGTITDVDSGALTGVAITGTSVNTGTGYWEYYDTLLSAWTAIGSVSDSHALLLYTTDQIRFIPDGKNGCTATITYRAWDQTNGAGTYQSYVDTSGTNNGGTTPFSTATETATLIVDSVNDAPTIPSPAGHLIATLTEDDIGNGGVQVKDFVHTFNQDVDTGALEGIAVTAVTITSGTGLGHWQYSIDNRVSWTDMDAFPVSDTAALLLRDTDWVRFNPDGKNACTAEMTYRAWDQISDSAGLRVDTSVNGGTTAFSTATDIASVVVTDLNDAPTLTISTPTLNSITEDDQNNSGQNVHSFTAGYIHDVDTGAVSGIAIIATSIASGPGGGNWQYSLDGGLSWSDMEPISSSSALLLTDSDLIRFNPDGYDGCNATISYKAWDQTYGSAGSKVDTTLAGLSAFSSNNDTATVVVTSVNDAPDLNPIAPILNSIDEDDTSNAGQKFDDFIGSSISDHDAGALTGVAITATSVSTGTGYWEYSIDGGSNWLLLGTVSDSNARLLDINDFIRFHPDGANGCIATITYRAWDQSSGVHNTVADTTTNGGSTAFSAATDTATLTVSSVNDAPTLTPCNPFFNPITENQTSNAGQPVSDLITGATHDDDTGALQGIAITAATITSGPGTGTWQYFIFGGTVWTNFPPVTVNTALLLRDIDLIRFVPDGANSCTATITYQAWDQTVGSAGSSIDASASGGTTAFSPLSDTATIVIMALNDAPVLTAISPTLSQIDEDQQANSGQTVSSFIGSSISDVDASHLTGIAIIGTTIASGTGTGNWQYSIDGGTTWANIDPVSNTNALLLRDTDLVRFNPDKQNGCTATITYRAWDQTVSTAGSWYDASTNGGTTAFSAGTDTATITVDSVNDAPNLTPSNPTLTTINEDDIGNIGQSVASFITGSVSDVDTGAVQGIAITGAVITSGTGSGHWQYSVDNRASWIDILPVSTTNALLLRATDFVRFSPDGKNGCIATITYCAWDQTSNSFGNKVDTSVNGDTTAFSTVADTATITVTSVNDAPVLNPINPILNPITEDDIGNGGQSVASIIGSSISDEDTGASQGIAIVATSITSGAGSGSWQYSIGGGAWTDIEPVSNNNALLLADTDYIRFNPDGANGCTATLTYRAWDQTSSTSGSRADASTNGGTTAFSSVPDTATIVVDDLNDPSSFSGTIAGRTITDDDTVQPFSLLTITDVDANQNNVYTITLNDPSYGSLSGGTGTYNSTLGAYTFNGTAANAQSCFRSLVFHPTPHLVSPGSTFTATFTLQSNDGAPLDNHTSVITHCVNHPSLFSGGLVGRSIDDNVTTAPFANLTITDPDYDQINTYTITLDSAANGTLSGGTGSYDPIAGIYTFTGTAAQAEACFQSLTFTPTANQLPVGSILITQFTITSSDSPTPDNSITIDAISIKDASIFSGTVPNQLVDDDSTLSPFTHVTITDPDTNHINIYTITLNNPQNGVLTGGLGHYDTASGTYSFTGNAVAATNDFRSLVFVPTPNLVPVGATITTTFTLQSNDGAVPDSNTSVIANSINDPSTFIGTIPSSPINSGSEINPFSSFIIQDPDSGQINIYEITIINPSIGTLTEESLNTTGFTYIGNGAYQFQGTASQAQNAFHELTFQPINNPAGGVGSTGFIITSSDGFSQTINAQLYVKFEIASPVIQVSLPNSKGLSNENNLQKVGIHGIEFSTGKPIVLGSDLVGKFLANQQGASIGLTNILESPLHYTSKVLGVYSLGQLDAVQVPGNILLKNYFITSLSSKNHLSNLTYSSSILPRYSQKISDNIFKEVTYLPNKSPLAISARYVNSTIPIEKSLHDDKLKKITAKDSSISPPKITRGLFRIELFRNLFRKLLSSYRD
jgi:plastocyanin